VTTLANLRDVAQRSGVSVATVSHVLNNRNGNMNARTRQRVLDAMRELGYRPGTVPVGAAQRRSNAIGVFVWVSPYETEPLLGNVYAVSVLDGIVAQTIRAHWNVMLVNVTAWEDARAQIRQFVDGRCDGFVLIAPPQGLEITEALAERGYPFVVVNAGTSNLQVSSVDIDNVAAGRDITEHLIANGHRRIAFLLGEETYDNTRERLEGFRQAFQRAGLPASEDLVLWPGTYEIGAVARRLERLLDRRARTPVAERPTAILCGNDAMASEAHRILRSHSLRVPEDVSLAGFDDSIHAIQMEPSLTTVAQPLQRLGARATEILLTQIAAGEDGASGEIMKEYLPHRLVVRDSVAAISTDQSPMCDAEGGLPGRTTAGGTS
jgi:LacI family transcriptional regulator